MKKRNFLSVLIDILLFGEFKIYSVEKEFSSLSAECQLKPAKYPSRSGCAERCDKFKGVFIPGTTTLVCFSDSKNASLTSLIDEETNNKECGYKGERSLDKSCNPIITCDGTHQECLEVCSKYTVYFVRTRKYFAVVLYCGPASEMEVRTIDYRATQYYLTREDGTLRNGFQCTCGIGQEGTEISSATPPRRQRRVQPNEDADNEMVASCPHIFLKYKREECEVSCKLLNGIYSRHDKQFICFHSGRKEVEMQKLTPEFCECGVTTRNSKLRSGECPPERRIQVNNKYDELHCPEKCANYAAYIFSPSPLESDTLYCELPSYIFKGLSYEIGKTVVVDTHKGNKYRKFECKCGLRLPLSQINSKISTFLLNEGRNGRNHSYVGGNENEIGNSLFPRNLMQGGENSLDSQNHHSVTPIVGNKRSPQRTSLLTTNEIDESVKKGKHITSSPDKIVIPAELETPSTSCQHATWPNNTHSAVLSSPYYNDGRSRTDINAFYPRSDISGIRQPSENVTSEGTLLNSYHNIAASNNVQIASSSSSKNMGYNRGIQNDEDWFRDIFAGTTTSSNLDNYIVSTRSSNPDLTFDLSEILITGDIDSPPTHCSHIGAASFAANNGERGSYSRNMGIGQNLSRDRGLIRNNRTVLNRHTISSNDITSQNTPAEPIWDEYDTSRISLSKSPSFLFPNATMEINDVISYQHTPFRRNINNDIEESVGVRCTPQSRGVGSSTLQNMGLVSNTSRNMGHDDGDMMRSMRDNTLAAETRQPSPRTINYDDIPRTSFSDSMSFLFPNVTLEINDVIKPARDRNPLPKFRKR